MKINGLDGRSGFCKLSETAISKSTVTFAGGYVFIAGKGPESYFDTLVDATVKGGVALPVGAVVRLDAWETAETSPLKEGDTCTAIEMDVSSWTKDCPAGSQEGEIDYTTQEDHVAGRKDLRGDDNITETGTINGLYDTASDMQRELEGLFIPRIVDTGKGATRKVTYIPRQKGKTYWHWFTYHEMSDEGEVEVTLFRKLRISSISAAQPETGTIPFSFNYTMLDHYQYERTVSA